MASPPSGARWSADVVVAGGFVAAAVVEDRQVTVEGPVAAHSGPVDVTGQGAVEVEDVGVAGLGDDPAHEAAHRQGIHVGLGGTAVGLPLCQLAFALSLPLSLSLALALALVTIHGRRTGTQEGDPGDDGDGSDEGRDAVGHGRVIAAAGRGLKAALLLGVEAGMHVAVPTRWRVRPLISQVTVAGLLGVRPDTKVPRRFHGGSTEVPRRFHDGSTLPEPPPPPCY